MRILIAVPTFESIFPDTYKSIFDLDWGPHQVAFDYVRGYDVAAARNMIAQKAIDSGSDYVLMVDNDVILPGDALINLTDDPKDVCLGYYPHRDDDNVFRGRTSVCRTGYHGYPLESEYTVDEMKAMMEAGEYKVQINGGGMGCALISTDALRKLGYPWYRWVIYDENESDKKRGSLSEDLYFCETCHIAQIPVYTDTRVGCGHIFRRPVWPE